MPGSLSLIILELDIQKEAKAAMMTVDDPKFVDYPQYHSEGLYLRWLPIRIDAKPTWADGLEYYEFEDEMIEWLCENCRGRFSTKHWAFVCFEDRQDAMLFKLAFQ
ncbi:hypothetical protein D3C87_1667870 [compost metagenome]